MSDVPYGKPDKALKNDKFTGKVDGSGDGKQAPNSGLMHKKNNYAVGNFNQAWKTGKVKDSVYEGGNGMD